jgi:hypothetical protein
MRLTDRRSTRNLSATEIAALSHIYMIDCFWNVMAHAQNPDLVFRRNGRVHLNRRGRQFSRLLAAKVCASAVVMLDTSCSKVVCRVLATHSIRQFPLHFLARASPCAITSTGLYYERGSGIMTRIMTWIALSTKALTQLLDGFNISNVKE